MPELEQLFPRQGSLLGSINFDTRYQGRAVPSFDNYQMTNSADVLHYFVDCIETIAPLGTSTGGQPRMYAGANNLMYRLDNGIRTTDTTFTAVTGVVQGMVICDAGGAVTTSIGTLAAGTKMLLVGFGSSTAPRVAYRGLATDTTAWTTQTSSTYAQFFLVAKAGADVYAVTDAGVAVLGEYRVSKCPSGNDPTLAASWGNGLEVGTPEWAITGLAAVGDSIVAGKPDGLYYYNDQTKRFENVLPHLIQSPHALNGKGMKSVTNGVLYPTHDGKLYFFDGVAVQEVTPLKDETLPRDVLTSRITAIADNGDTVACVMECFQNTSQGFGLKVITRIAGTYTDVTTSVTNGDFTDGANVGTFGNAADDCILVGADIPLEAVNVWVTRNVNAAVQSFTTPQYSNGTTGTVAPFDSSFTSFTAGSDFTILSTAAISLVNTGFPAAASNARLTWTDIDAFQTSTLGSIQFGGSIGTLSKYWYRWKRTSATGMTAGTTIDELESVPSRAGFPDKGVLAQSTNFSHRYRAGCMTRVLLGRRERTVGFTWHEVYAVNTLGGVWAIGWTSGRVPAGANLGQSLVLWGRAKQYMLSEGFTRDPARTPWAFVAAYASAANACSTLALTDGGTYLGDETRRKQVKRILIDARYMQPADTISVYGQWDEVDAFHIGDMHGGPGAITNTAGGDGRYFQAWATLSQNDNGAMVPEIRGVWAEYDYVGDPFDFVQDQADSSGATKPRT